MASALQLGPLLQPNPAGCRQLQQIAAAATQRLSGTVDADGAVIVMVELAGGAAAVRCPGEDEDDWAVVVNWDDPTKPARCLNPACQAVRQYDGFADCIINVDNRALFTWELCISYCNEFATRAKVTFFGFWRSSLARYALAGQLESVVCEALLASGSLRTKFQDGVMDFITLQKLPYASEMACCDGSTCCADGMAMGIALSKACLSDESTTRCPTPTRLGHLGFDNLAKMPDMVTGIRVTAAEFKTAGANALCEPCTLGKQHRLPFNTSTSATKAPLELLHTDLCGPLPVASAGGSLYFNTILDDFTGMSFVTPLRHKSDAADSIIHTVTMLQRQAGLPVKRAERLNRTLWEKARPMLSDAGLPKHLWADAIVTANYLRNRSPLSGRDKTPFELFYGTKPDVSHLRIFGATVFAHTPSALRTKLDPVSQPGRLIGYAANRKGYKILLNSGAIITSRDVTFDESKPPKPTSPTSHKPPSQPETSQPEPVPFAFDSDTEDRAKCASARRPASEWQDDAYRITGRSNVAANAAIANEPTTMKEALSGPDAAAWQLAMDDEMASLIANDLDPLRAAPRHQAHPSQADAGLFISTDPSKLAYLLTYVDDILIVTPKTTSSAAIKQKLMAAFEARDLDNATFFLGMDLIRDRTAKTIKLAQSRNIKDPLQ
ncbi:reverse transcriptase,R, partial [Micractinium conductrix]